MSRNEKSGITAPGKIEAAWQRTGAELHATLYQGAPSAHMSGYGLPSASEVAADRSAIGESQNAEKDSVLAAYQHEAEPERSKDDRDIGMDRD